MRKKLVAFHFPRCSFFTDENFLQSLVLYTYPGLESRPQAVTMLLQPPKSIWWHLDVWFSTSCLLCWKLGNMSVSSKCGRCPRWYFGSHSALKYEDNWIQVYCSWETLGEYLNLGLWKLRILDSFSRMLWDSSYFNLQPAVTSQKIRCISILKLWVDYWAPPPAPVKCTEITGAEYLMHKALLGNLHSHLCQCRIPKGNLMPWIPITLV